MLPVADLSLNTVRLPVAGVGEGCFGFIADMNIMRRVGSGAIGLV